VGTAGREFQAERHYSEIYNDGVNLKLKSRGPNIAIKDGILGSSWQVNGERSLRGSKEDSLI
jgi:hypothetical protein